jgi:hypothetical protein
MITAHPRFGRHMFPGPLAIVLAAIAALVAPAARAADQAIRFDRDIRPLLSDNCYACHGPGKQEAGLRLDSAEAAAKPLDGGGQAVVPGDLARSELIARIMASDPDVVMPPPHTKKTLSAAQKDLLQRWIAAGGVYEKHWSFQPVVRPPVPAVVDAKVTNPVDRFLESQISAEGLPLNGEADRPTLIRRVSFALTGLPPTPDEVAAFVADPSPDAYEKLVERLLASPHHGEEMARHWLDAARYADTHGLHLDNERQMWAYRDWVVKAFNANMPFDQFTIEQLAGDLLPSATRDQKTATGFSRCNVTTSEGGSINDELLFRYAVDRTATMTNVWLGLTGQCAVCHSHKFDPLSHREFYSLYAFFNSAADPGFDGNSLTTAPVLPLPTPEQEKQVADLGARLPLAEKSLQDTLAAVVYADPATTEPRPQPKRAETIWLDDEFPPNAAVQSAGNQIGWFTSGTPGEVRAGHRSLERTATGIGQDFYSSGAAPLSVGPNAEIFADVWLDPANPPKAVMVQFHTKGWEHRAVWGDLQAIPWGEAGKPSRIHAGSLPKPGVWTRITVAADKLGLKPDSKITGFALTQFDGHVRWDLVGTAAVEDPAVDASRSLVAWWKQRAGKKPKELVDVPDPLKGLVGQGPEKTTKPEDVAKVRNQWMANVWQDRPESLKKLAAEIATLRKTKEDTEKAIVKTFVFNDMPTMRESFVMLRGAYDKKGEPVERATPEFLPPLPIVEGIPLTRLDLAKWLLLPEQPLTARVAANRLWQQFFGTGLVKTSEDFGLQGEPPSHPELLDWLATEYRETGWDTRKMVRLLVTSRAFRRAAPIQPEQLARDPENRLLARGPRIRLDAEQIRDNALAVSGLLVRTLGGKGVRPYQPDNIWEPVGFAGSNTQKYTRDSGAALYRRSLYTFLKRTAPPPFMANFDAPNREQFCARRERSNTPLQALQLMNDVQHVEAARALAERTLAAAPADASRVDWLFRAVLARPPEAAEAGIVLETLAGNRTRYQADPAAASKAIGHGESKPTQGVPADELAAWTLVANMILNLDETLTRN